MSDPTAIADAPEDDGDADNIKLFPAWRQTLAELEQAGIHAGQVISKRWLEERFGIREPSPSKRQSATALFFFAA